MDTQPTKSGRLTLEEQEYIRLNMDKVSIAEIAASLNRRFESVEKYIATCKSNPTDKHLQPEYNLTLRPFWSEFKKQFSPDELKLAVYHWDRIVGQFKQDVTPTEELQLIEIVRMELLMNRALTEQRTITGSVENLQSLIDLEKDKDIIDRDVNLMIDLERNLMFARQAQSDLIGQYNTFLDKKKGMLKEVKGTRAERIKHIQDSKENFTGWITKILSDVALRKTLGMKMEKHRIATKVEYERLSDWHKYEDGSMDRPILNSDTVVLEDEDVKKDSVQEGQ